MVDDDIHSGVDWAQGRVQCLRPHEDMTVDLHSRTGLHHPDAQTLSTGVHIEVPAHRQVRIGDIAVEPRTAPRAGAPRTPVRVVGCTGGAGLGKGEGEGV